MMLILAVLGRALVAVLLPLGLLVLSVVVGWVVTRS
jgi:hypothetical protein